MRKIAVISLALLCGQWAVATPSRSIHRVSSLQVRADGKFDLICNNGAFETASVEDISNNVVCGGANTPLPLKGLRSAIRNQEMNFDALCSNGQRQTISAADLSSGHACFQVDRQLLGGRYLQQTSAELIPGKIYFVGFSTTAPLKITGWGINLAVNRDPEAVLAIYRAEGGKPKTLVMQSRVIEVDTNRLYLTPASGDTLPAGDYFLAYRVSGPLAIGANYLEEGSTVVNGEILMPYSETFPTTLNADLYKASEERYAPNAYAIAE